MSSYKDELKQLTLFSDASRSELVQIRRYLTPLPVAAGRVLVQEGERGDQFMIIAEGEATVSRGDHTIATLERGDLVGEMALLEDQGVGRRNATVTASTDAKVYVGTRSEFRRILETAPSVARKVHETAAARKALETAASVSLSPAA